jgi:hypothetical protein
MNKESFFIFFKNALDEGITKKEKRNILEKKIKENSSLLNEKIDDKKTTLIHYTINIRNNLTENDRLFIIYIMMVQGSKFINTRMVDPEYSKGKTPFMCALNYDYMYIANYLRQNGARLGIKLDKDEEEYYEIFFRERLKKTKKGFKQKNGDVGTSIIIYSKQNQKELLLKILKDEGNKQINKREGGTHNTALHYAVINVFPEITKILISNGAKCNILNESNETPVMMYNRLKDRDKTLMRIAFYTCLKDNEKAPEEAKRKLKPKIKLKAKREAEARAKKASEEDKRKLEADLKAKREAEARAKKASEEAKRKLEADLKAKREAEARAKKASEEAKRKLEADLKAKKASEEAKRKLEAYLKAKREAEARAKKVSEEAKRKLEADLKAKKVSEEAKRKLEADLKAKKASEEAKRKLEADLKAKREAEARAKNSFILKKGDEPAYCLGDTISGEDCKKDAYWRYKRKQYCTIHLPKEAKILREKGSYKNISDKRLGWAK